MLFILSAGIAPGLALLSYFYLKDQYDQEPVLMVFKVFLFGVFITFPIMFIQYVIDAEGLITNNILHSYVSASLLEEFFKWFMLFFAVYQHADFDEPYDGIVYGVSISLGFATVENILFLVANGVGFAFGRALFPVSSHALFGVLMGYYLGKAKFNIGGKKHRWILISFFVPFLLHGLYDYILLTQEKWLYYLLPFMFFLWWFGIRKVKHAHILTKKHYMQKFNEKSTPF
ncbi:glutamic-type intramembrane protease PrsW [Lederbergia lenta]|uniref:Protease PrsW n=1 Tax=Lederbergia lenta TaxID=1467 RepID=A0A2X4W0E1_LEDLE|nr:glutamic-type intramembrane protease PrsW [Lederbergia lenta]MCM3111628.1 glutamic-type intramembrane protease PrsW [Lederbergia lenta]MEC2324980.1 glutamic-type intramembrane protease PrsW [Lederbergia lenta]SQI56523.1 protease required for RsiW anti-sigma(W) degradation [Lederbergia lenta]